MTVRDPFGLLAFLQWNHPWNSFHFDDATRARAIVQLKELGVRWIRTDILWHDIHRGTGQYDFSAYDRWIPELRRNGLEPMVLLHYNKDRVDANGTEVWNRPPDSNDEFAAYVHATVSRYKSDVTTWEIWNEPNHPVYWSGPKDGLETYVGLLRAARAAAKAADPACSVVNGGLTEPIVEDVENFYARGGKDLTDVMNVHTFINPLDPEGRQRFDAIMTGVRRAMERNGDAAKPVWITEMGCPGIPEGRPRQAWFSGEAMNEEQQADWLDRQYAWIEEYPYVEKLFWAFYRDTDGIFKDATDYFGLVRLDLTPKPAFHRLARRIRAARERANGGK